MDRVGGIKAEAIEPEGVYIETKVRKQESKYFVVAIVKQAAKKIFGGFYDIALERAACHAPVPKIMTTFTTFMEVLMVSAIKLIKTIEHVLRCMRVHHIEEHGQTHPVSSIYKFCQVFRGTVSGTRGEKGRDLVAKS